LFFASSFLSRLKSQPANNSNPATRKQTKTSFSKKKNCYLQPKHLKEKVTTFTQPKVATRKKVQTLNQKKNPKRKEPSLKVATFTKPKVAT
jgi:hypothetical protein